MTDFEKQLRNILTELFSFYRVVDRFDANSNETIRKEYLVQRSVFLNLHQLGKYFKFRIERNVALYKFCIFPIYIKNTEVSTAWFDLLANGKTNEDVVKFFCLANDIVYGSFPQISDFRYDGEWYSKWLNTPIENFQSFGLSAEHAIYLSTGGPGW